MKFIKLYVLTVLVFAVAGFSKKPIKEDVPTPLPPVVVTPAPTPEVPTAERISLYWENTTEAHPERAPWSDEVTSHFKTYLNMYSAAKDITDICPRYSYLDDKTKVKALSEFWVAVAYYESAFKPTQESVDVGTKYDKDSWSVGLYQMSAVDSSAKAMGVDYKGLKDPVKNIKVAQEQLRRQVSNTGLFLLPKSHKNRYWAVILKGGKYQKISEILSRTLKQVPACRI